MAASAPVHAFPEFLLPLLCTICFQRHWLLSKGILIKTVVSNKTRINPVALPIINPLKKLAELRMKQPYTQVKFFPNKPWFLRVCSTNLLQTVWEKKKLLITSNFSFSLSVFYPFGELSGIFIKLEIVVCSLFQFGRVRNLSFGKGLIMLLIEVLKLGNIGSECLGVRRGPVVKCLTCNPGVLGSSRTGSSGSFCGSVLGQDIKNSCHSVLAQPSTGKTQESMNNVICCRDMTEILLKAA